MEGASFLLSKEDHSENSRTPTQRERQKAWALNLNGFDVEEARSLRLSGKPQKVPEGYENRLNVLYSQKAMPGSSKSTCPYIPSLPDRILDAPEICNDYYLNLVDWSSGNVLAVALDHSVYLWRHPTAAAGHTARVLSLAMSPDGATVASAAADETLRMWRCFELDPARRREREKARATKSSLSIKASIEDQPSLQFLCLLF
ncbi:Cell division cycle protein 20 like protein [Myotis davidii]|uniref:Cell division cycle protein 20 like protein n=1 Tax=Myotis davidii TaxID=225400 RepID=L5M8E5_MYODS|nr:Cell division cycle protein 20 like protein [Myotis davidii]